MDVTRKIWEALRCPQRALGKLCGTGKLWEALGCHWETGVILGSSGMD